MRVELAAYFGYTPRELETLTDVELSTLADIVKERAER